MKMKIFGFLMALLGAAGAVLVVLEFVLRWDLVTDDILIETILGSLTFLVGGILLIVNSTPKKHLHNTEE